MMFFKYLNYIIRHKWFVMVECFKAGMIWRGIAHDLSKFFPSEFFAYAEYFYGNKDKSIHGQYKTQLDFDKAWLFHQHRNKHHWQYWILKEDESKRKVIPMPKKYIKEMICDWVGAGKAQGFKSPKEDKYFETRNWYKKNKDKMVLSIDTIAIIEMEIGIRSKGKGQR